MTTSGLEMGAIADGSGDGAEEGGGGVSRDPKELGEMVCAVGVAVGTS